MSKGRDGGGGVLDSLFMRVLVAVSILAACSSRPYEAFDEGYEIHFILATRGKPLRAQVVCTAGSVVEKTPLRTLQPAAEVAILKVPPGDHRLSVWDAAARSGARVEIGVDHDLWVLHWVKPGGGPDGEIEVYTKPPTARLERGWSPLVTVPR